VTGSFGLNNLGKSGGITASNTCLVAWKLDGENTRQSFDFLGVIDCDYGRGSVGYDAKGELTP
jgi:hypothetical protein